MLRLEGLVKRFGALTAVDRISLDIPQGQMLGVIGRSGAGKSTMLRLINRLADPTEGRISWDDVPVSALRGRPLRDWRAQCAMVFQQFHLVDRLDVVTNVLMGRLGYKPTMPTLLKRFSAEERAMAIRALDRLDLAEAALQRAATLSGGQQQRVAIARALVQNPRLILADEPVASLDVNNAKRVMDALRRINREDGITVISNLHHLDTAREYCDRIVGIAAGRVVFDGVPEALGSREVLEVYGSEEAAQGWEEDLPTITRPQPRPALVGATA